MSKTVDCARGVLPDIAGYAADLAELRHRIHAHPELGFEEFATSDLVAAKLAEWGYEVHRGLAGTGVVGTLKNGEGKTIGIRADMDALPIVEATGLPYASRVDGKMHACGHDGHTTMLLGAAWYLAQHKPFAGTVHLIFQPAEEGLGGARVMVEQGLFERFPCDAVFGMHNMPGHPVGQFCFRPGPFSASSDTVEIEIVGKGGHGAAPNMAVDPIVASANLILALQTVVARNVHPSEMAVVTVGAIHGGDAANVIPGSVKLRLTVRALKPAVRDLLQQRITDLAENIARAHQAEARVDYHRRYPAIINDAAWTEFAMSVAQQHFGEERAGLMEYPMSASEDFSFMLEACPGSYLLLGNGDGEGGCMVHNPGYDFNDALLPIGASYWVHLVEHFLGQ